LKTVFDVICKGLEEQKIMTYNIPNDFRRDYGG
jgi:hypothetical protein